VYFEGSNRIQTKPRHLVLPFNLGNNKDILTIWHRDNQNAPKWF